MMRTPVLLALVVSTLASTSLASAQDDVQLAAWFVLGAGGGAELEGELGGREETLDYDLDPTVGLGLRGEVPLMDYFAIGGLLELSWLRLDDDDPGTDEDRNLAADFSLWLKPRYWLSTSSFELELYLGIPFGFTVLQGDDELDTDAALGFNVGLLGGAQIVFGKVGAFVELGWRRHQVFPEDVELPFVGTIDEITLRANQFRMHFGAAIHL